MPWDALPEHIDEPSEWKGTDSDVWYMRWKLYIKGWIAYGPRCSAWWARWRECPMVLLAFLGVGRFRIEYTDGSKHDMVLEDRVLFLRKFDPYYLSMIQYWARWSFQIQWPFFVSFHWYFDEDDMPMIGERPTSRQRKLIYFRFGCRRDSDRVYWFPSMFIGIGWN